MSECQLCRGTGYVDFIENGQHNAIECSKCRVPQTPKNPNAVALGRLGGKLGVKNPLKAHSTEQARAAVMVRWNRVKQEKHNEA